MRLEGERDDREPPAASGSWPRASWPRSEEFVQYRCAGQSAVRHEDGAAPWVPGERGRNADGAGGPQRSPRRTGSEAPRQSSMQRKMPRIEW
jgi:hypothetical protein